MISSFWGNDNDKGFCGRINSYRLARLGARESKILKRLKRGLTAIERLLELSARQLKI